jgi:hypothetical protein
VIPHWLMPMWLLSLCQTVSMGAATVVCDVTCIGSS